MTEEHRGGCLCGAVRFSLRGPLRDVIACHCRQCRKTSGHFVAMTSVPMDRILVDGGDALRWYESSSTARRGFCGVCGSNLFWKPLDEDRISVAAGALDGPTGLRTVLHIHCATKGDYYDIPGDVAAREGD